METTKVDIPSSVSSTANQATMLSMAQIKLDSDLQIRVNLSEETIDAYAKEMQDDVEFPSVDVFYDGSVYLLANGFHRYHAASRLGRKEISAHVRQGDLRDAVLFAIGADANTALRRSNEDKNKAVGLLLADDEWTTWSDGKLAKLAGVSDRFVAKLRKERTPNGSGMTSVKYTKDGEDRVMNVRKKGRSEIHESDVNATAVKTDDLALVDGVMPSDESDSQDVQATALTDMVAPIVKEDIAKRMSHRKMSSLEALAIGFSDALDAMLTKNTVPDDKAIVAVGDVEVLVRRFLEKFSKDEV